MGAPIREVPEKVARSNPITYISADAKPPPFFLAHGKSKAGENDLPCCSYGTSVKENCANHSVQKTISCPTARV